MSAKLSLKHYLPIAFVVVIALAGLVGTHPRAIFGLLDPAATLERERDQRLYAIGAAGEPLDYQEAIDLLERYQSGQRAALSALAQQDARHGLPEEFLTELESRFTDSGGQDRAAAGVIRELAEHRPFGAAVEQTLADTMRPATGGVSTYPMDTLARLATHRPLAAATLSELIDIAGMRGYEAQSALTTLDRAASAHGLPDWALDRLAEIAEQHRGTARSGAIKVIASAGDKERARTLLNTLPNPMTNPGAIASALPSDDLTVLVAELDNEANSSDLRVGALEAIVKRRDQSELVGAALTYAFNHDDTALRRAAFATYPEWGRHHARYIAVDWPSLCAAAFADPEMRYVVVSAFRFVPFANRDRREAFLLEMLAGSPSQQAGALAALAWEDPLSEPLQQAIVGLMSSPDAQVAQQAGVLYERFRPRGRFEGLGSWLAGALLWGLLGLPALTAVGFETYYVARLFQSFAAGTRRVRALLISVVWFSLSVALGYLLFAGLLGLGHGGRISWEVYVALLVINLVFAGVGWLLVAAVRGRAKALAV